MEIKRPKEFVSLGVNRTEYERVKDQIEALEGFIPEYKRLLLKKMGIRSSLSMGGDTINRFVSSGDVKFELQAERRKSKTSYKTIVVGWEANLNGINFATETRTLTGVIKEDDKNYISCESALDDFVKIAYGTLNPTVELNIKPEGTTGVKETDRIVVPEKAVLDSESAIAYFNAQNMLGYLKELSKSYREETNAAAQTIREKVVPVTQKTGYKAGTIEREITDWTYAVKTLITMPEKKARKNAEPGELEMLADEEISLNYRVEMFGSVYELIKKKPYGNLKLYVGVNSLLDRIDDLKKGPDGCKRTAIVYKAEHREI
jgi:hypothetical protein